MENNAYQIYVDGCVNLAQSIVLKSEHSAAMVNQYIDSFYGEGHYIKHDPTTWKYYLNLSGKYFHSDTVMEVVSLDTLETIVFSKENLAFHRATAKAYAFGTEFYKELVARYPLQEQLIRGILYPANMEQAIAAQDGTILAYPSEFVESTEYGFIDVLQDWIYKFHERWTNVQFRNSDNLYEATMLGVMYAQMIPAIMNIRLGFCKTHAAHSYHVKQYLSSHSNLAPYLPYLTRAQMMFFYRNIEFIETHAGKNDTFNILLEQLFTKRNLPLAHFKMHHSSKNMPAELKPLINFRRIPLNTETNADGVDYYSLDQVLDLEDELLDGNLKYRDEEEPRIIKGFERSLSAVVATKLLESKVVDYKDSEVYTRSDILLNHWAYLSNKGLYRAYVQFTIPSTGLQISLPAKDAFAFYAYAYCRGQKMTIEKLPKVVCNHVQRIPKPSIADMKYVTSVVSDDWLQQVHANMPGATSMISVIAFYEHCSELFYAANNQRKFAAAEEGVTARAQKHAAYLRLWSDEVIDLADTPDQQYADWFAERNISVKEFSDNDLAEIANEILRQALGLDLSEVITLEDIQKAMSRMFLQLSSYSIQIASTINDGPVLAAGQNTLRYEDFKMKSLHKNFLFTAPVDDYIIKRMGFHKLELDLTKFTRYENFRHSYRQKVGYPLSRLPVIKGNTAFTPSYKMVIGTRMKPILGEMPPNPRNLPVLPGMEKFLLLPLEDQLKVPDAWQATPR